MGQVRVKFGMPFINQAVPPDYQWDDVIGEFHEGVDYLVLAKRLLLRLPVDGPSHVSIYNDDRLIAHWSRDKEREEREE